MPTTKTPKRIRRQSRIAVQIAVGGSPSAVMLRRFARAALQTSAPARAELALRVVGAHESRNLNGKYRKKNRPTNVLSFAYGNGSGDVVLCHPVIKKEAELQQKSLRAHYAHLVIHGVLHLRGHDHLRKAEAARMEKTEVRLLRRLGFADPYEVK